MRNQSTFSAAAAFMNGIFSALAILICAGPAFAQSTLIPLYRYVYATNGDHFYTTNAAEIGTTTPGQIGKYNFKSEGIAGYVYSSWQTGLTPLYRFYKAPGHFYTTNANEIGTILPTTPSGTVVNGWTYEGIMGYLSAAPAGNAAPLYRYVNGSFHFYTANSAEIGTITAGQTGAGGWKSEGFVGYIFTSPSIASAPDGYTRCATGDQSPVQTCWFPGQIKEVAYGDGTATGTLYAIGMKDFVQCQLASFSGDPKPGVVKSCFVSNNSSIRLSYTACAMEGGTCTFSGTKTVIYGVEGRYLIKTATSSIACNVSAFGGDPYSGRHKGCFVSP